MDDPLLAVRDLSTWFEAEGAPVRAVDGVSFDIRRGETFALLGESGCGKSMTALSLMQLVPEPVGRIMGGQVHFAGRDLLRQSEMEMRAVRGKRIGMIFQEPMTSLNPVLTVAEQIGEVLRRHCGLKGKAARDRIWELLDAVGIPAPKQRWQDYPHQLSGGMKQRVMIATALAGEPDLLIADEPTTALDVTIQAQVLALLRQIQLERGMAMLLITHDLGVVAEVADRVAVMYAGHIVEQAPVSEFFETPRHPYSQKLFASLPRADRREQSLEVITGSVPRLNSVFTGCRFAERCDYVWQACRDVPPAWTVVNKESGHGVRCHLADPRYRDRVEEGLATRRPAGAGVAVAEHAEPGRAQPGESLLSVSELKVWFPVRKGLLRRTVGHIRAVDGVDLEIGRGRTLALVGESGCGKTTAGKGILQLVRPTAGSVRFANEELTRLRGEALRRRRSDFQVVFQDPFASLNPRMMVASIIEEGMVAQRIGGADAAARRERIATLLERVGLAPDAMFRYPHEFSGGQRQRICIARALAVEPKLVVCDEPTSALDVSVQAQILNLLRELQTQLDLSYLFITHNLSVVEYLAHEVAVMYLGRIVEVGTVAEVMSQPRHPYTQALLSAVPRVERAEHREVIRLEGELPSPMQPPVGCHFHPRCPQATAECRRAYPGVSRLSDTHQVKCFLVGQGETMHNGQ